MYTQYWSETETVRVFLLKFDRKPLCPILHSRGFVSAVFAMLKWRGHCTANDTDLIFFSLMTGNLKFYKFRKITFTEGIIMTCPDELVDFGLDLPEEFSFPFTSGNRASTELL